MEDGRTAFALQVRGDDGWGERIEPRANLFPRVDRARVGRWANSSLLELDSGHTVRISARAEDGGRIEFALQEIIDDEPAERILPRLRKFPASPTVGKWLYSSPIELAAIDTGPPPPTHVALVNYRGQHAANVRYDSSLNDDGSVTSNVYTNSEEGGDWATDGFGASFAVWCWNGQNLGILLDGLAPQDAESLSVTLTIDGAADPASNWTVHHYVDNGQRLHATLHAPDAGALFARLQSVAQLSAVIDGVSGTHTWNLADTFSTPIQGNLAECGNYVEGQVQEPPPPTYVPWIGSERLSATLSYGADRLDNGNISSSVNKDVFLDGAFQGRLRFTLGCWDSQWLDLRVDGLPESDETSRQVTVRIDDQDEVVEAWRSFNESGRQMIATTYARGLLLRLKGASSVTFTIAGSDLTPVTFDLTGIFETPIQDNLDNCDMYKPGEVRELELPESPVVGGRIPSSDGESTIDWSSRPSGNAIPEIWTRHMLIDGEIKIYFMLNCNPNGATIVLGGTRFGALEAGPIEVIWSVDGGAEQRETWQVYVFFGFGYAYGEDTLSLVSAWRNGATLDIMVENATAHTQRFDLEELFGTPIQDALDECLALPVPDLPLPAGEVEQTTDGQLDYDSGGAYGRSVASTSLSLRYPSDDAPDWAGYGSRVATYCGIEGYRVVIWSIGLDRPVFIRGYSVDVTWSVDGGSETTDTWDVWPGSGGDSYNISPQDDAAFYAAINGADSLTITVGSDPEFVQTYELGEYGFWETPVQPNLDACLGS